MTRRLAKLTLLILGIAPIAVFSAQQPAAGQGPKAEEVFKNVEVFKGVPASDMIPAMEFMCASMNYKCTDCHDPKDYAADTPDKKTAREMVLLQRDINEKWFNGRLEVTCMTCHNAKNSHPEATPMPKGIVMRHEQMEEPPKAADLFAKHIEAIGKDESTVTRKGTLAAPNDETHKMESNPLEFVQAPGGVFNATSGARKFESDGKEVKYGGNPMTDEPAAIFGRIGRAYRGEKAFEGLERIAISGKDKIGTTEVVVVRANRPATTSTEEMYFDPKTGLLMRLVNVRRSTIGSVVTVIDYSDYKTVGAVKTPMKVVVTFPGGDTWTMDFKEAEIK